MVEQTQKEKTRVKFSKALGALRTLLVEKRLELKPELNENFGYDFQNLFESKKVTEEDEKIFVTYTIQEKELHFEQAKKVITFEELLKSMEEKVDNTGNISKVWKL